MYGSASSSVPTSRISGLRSCRVVGVDPDVLMPEVGEEDLGLGPLPRQADLVLELGALHGRLKRLLVVADRRTGRADVHPLDSHVDGERRRVAGNGADGLH